MSHRGSLLCLPSGIWASPIVTSAAIDEASLTMVLEEIPPVELCVIGTGAASWIMPQALRDRFRERHISVETMTTGAAVRTYNILMGEKRRIAALLLAVN
jgi:uncharacterized protein